MANVLYFSDPTFLRYLKNAEYVIQIRLLNFIEFALMFRTVSVFIMFDTYIIFHTEYVLLFVISLPTIFHKPSSSGSLVIAIKP